MLSFIRSLLGKGGAKDGAKKAEHQHYKGDDDIVDPKFVDEFVSAEALDAAEEGHHADVDGVAVVENPEGAADDEDEGYDVGLVDEAVEEGAEYLPRLRCGVDAVERVVEYHFTAVDHLACVFACRYDPGKDCSQHDESEDDNEGMGNLFQIEN